MKKVLLSISLCLFVSISTLSAQTFSGGTGSDTDPYLISSKADMEELATSVNGGVKYVGKYFELTQDITGASNAITTVIGNSATNYFIGVFDGKGHTVEVNISVSSGYGGLFGKITTSDIKNLNVIGNVICIVNNTTNNFKVYLGGIVGDMSASIITNCSFNGVVSSNIQVASGYSYVGGICGYISDSGSQINKCSNSAEITSSILTSSSSGISYSGGICGFTSGENLIQNSFNTGKISAYTSSSTSASCTSYTGGISGYGYSSSIKNSYNTGKISASSSGSRYAGGIIGYYDYNTSIINCFAANEQVTNITDLNKQMIGRIGGNTLYQTTTLNCYALNSMLVNGDVIISSYTTNKNGKDTPLASFKDLTWLMTNMNWDFKKIWEVKPGGNFPTLRKEIIAFDIPTMTYGDEITLQATSPNTVSPITYESSDNNLAVVSGNTLTAKGVGLVTITASQAANGEYPATSTVYYLKIDKKNIIATANNLEMVYGDILPTFTCTYDGIAPGETDADFTTKIAYACTATSQSNVGAYTITPSGAVSSNYNFVFKPGTLTIQKRPLKVTTQNVERVYGNSNPVFTVNYDGFVNGNTFSVISVKPTATTPATAISPAGEYVITCSGGTATNYAITYGTAALTVTKAPMSVKANDFSRVYGTANPVFTLSYSGFKNTDTKSAFTKEPVITCEATVNSLAGEYPILVSGGEATNYDFSYSNGTLTITKVSQTISWTQTLSAYVGDAPIKLLATISSSMPITYSSSNNEVATIENDILTIIGAGTATITASQAGDNGYSPATSITKTITVSKKSQSLSWTQTLSGFVGDTPIQLSATSNSELPVAYTSSNTNVATIEGNVLTIVGEGTSTITAKQSGNNIYNAASEISKTITVSKKSQAITWTQTLSAFVDDAPIQLLATTNSELPVVYTSSNVNVATIENDFLTIVGEGTSTITAKQAGNGTYNAATNIVKTIIVSKRSQLITWDQTLSAKVGDDPILLTASSDSDLPIVYTSSNTNAATIEGKILMIVGKGVTVITASQPGNTIFKSAKTVDKMLIVSETTGIENNEYGAISIYPNPTKGIVNIKTANDALPLVNVYSIAGNLLLSESANQINISSFPKGIYIFKIGNKHLRVIKE